MDKIYQTCKSEVINFKLDYCCWIAPVRIGLMVTSYFNIVADLICLIGIANEGFSPTITRVQEILIEDNVNKPIPVLAYATELGFSVLLLCAIYRRDLILMRVFMYYTVMAVIMSFMIYSIVIAAVPLEIQLAIIFSTMFQMYVILLVRSVIVEMKMEDKKYELPTLVMSSLIHEKVTPGSAGTKNGQTHEIKITEVPKKQEVSVTVVGKQDEKVNLEATKDKKETEVKKDVELKKDAEVKVDAAQKKKDEKKKKEDEKKDKKEKDKEEKKKKDAEKAAKTKDNKDSKKDVKETWLQTVNEHPKE